MTADLSAQTDAEARAALILLGLSGRHLCPWLPGHDRAAARAEAFASMAGGSWGRIERQGIRGAAGLITWREVAETIERGCRAPGLRAAYEEAYRDWCAWATAGGYSPDDKDWTDQQRDDHDQRFRRAQRGIRDTTAAIIRAGCVTHHQQEALF